MKRTFLFITILFLLGQCSIKDPDRSLTLPAVSTPQPAKESNSSGKPFIIDAQSVPIDKLSSEKTDKGKSSRNAGKEYRPRIDSAGLTRQVAAKPRHADIDLNEPVSRNFLLSKVENNEFGTMITLSKENFLKINFDNDILNYTDRFYTNGIRIEVISPAFQYFPVSRLMVPYRRSGINYYGLSLVQNMYTPSTTKKEGILYGDRPYSSYLYLGTYKITNDPVHRFRQKSEMDIGVIGSYSLGEYVQKSFHSEVPTNTVPLGWEYQIKNDLVLNYSLAYEKGIFESRSFDMILNGAGCLGTLYTNISGGFMLRTGVLNPYFANLGIQKRKLNMQQGLRDFQFFFFIKSSGTLVGYDATLQGGLFNKTSVYTINGSYISRAVFEGSAGITLVYRGMRIDAEQFLLSPEFRNGWWHKWVHLGLTFAL